MRTCTDCQEVKEDYEFHIFRTNKSGMKNYYCRSCRECSKNNNRVISFLKKRFPPPPPSTPCALCHRIDKLTLDHCHATAQRALLASGAERVALMDQSFRGWCCAKCQTGLGHLGDSEEGVLQALRYLQRWRQFTSASELPMQDN